MFSILTLPLFYYVVLDLAKSRIVALIGFLMFSLNLALIYFSSELKPYSVDVSMYVLLVYLTISQHGFVARNRTLLLAETGCIAILFSNVTFIVLFCIGCYKLLGWIQNRRVNFGDLKIFLPWLIVFAVNYLLFIHKHPSTQYQRELYAFGFCPTDVLSCEFVSFLKKTIEETFFTMLLYISKAYGFAYLLLLIIIVAVAHMLSKRQYAMLIFTCLPVLFHLGLSALRLYPFWFRLILYLMPCLIFIISLGTYLIADFLVRKVHRIAGGLFIVVCCVFFTKESIAKFPLWEREIMPTLKFINSYPPAHVYTTDPANTVKYYYLRGLVKDSVYQEVDWFSRPADFYELVSEETTNYFLVYSTIYQYSYGETLQDLRRRGLVIKNLEYKGYGVSYIKPLSIALDTTLLRHQSKGWQGAFPTLPP